MRYNKPQSVFCLFQQTWEMEWKNGKTCIIYSKWSCIKKKRSKSSSSFCCIARAKVRFRQTDGQTDNEQRNSSWFGCMQPRLLANIMVVIIITSSLHYNIPDCLCKQLHICKLWAPARALLAYLHSSHTNPEEKKGHGTSLILAFPLGTFDIIWYNKQVQNVDILLMEAATRII